jgi:hypothetical protein
MTASARTRRSRNVPARVPTFEPGDEIAEAEANAIIVWRGERVPFLGFPARIAATDGRGERDAMFAAWIDGLEALNPLYEARLTGWRDEARASKIEDFTAAAAGSRDVQAVAREFEALSIASETVHHAALRRQLALIDIEQGDATIADLWHVARGSAWGQWFDARALGRAAAETGRDIGVEGAGEGWQAAEAGLRWSARADLGLPAAAVGELFASLVGDPAWLTSALRMADAEVAAFADFVAFVRLWRLRRLVGLTHYELRLYRYDDPAVQRAYYAGIVGHTTGLIVPEAAYLADVGMPFASVAEAERMMLAGVMGEVLSTRFGHAWWTEPDAHAVVDEVAGASRVEDALAQLGYDGLDWRPLLRQIRTRLIGEMSGYGGPNITTRAGTRKV